LHTIEKGLNKKQKAHWQRDPKILSLKHYICPMPHDERQLDLKRMKEPKAKRINTKKSLLETLGGHKLGD
jgi:hypothetical protein